MTSTIFYLGNILQVDNQCEKVQLVQILVKLK